MFLSWDPERDLAPNVAGAVRLAGRGVAVSPGEPSGRSAGGMRIRLRGGV